MADVQIADILDEVSEEVAGAYSSEVPAASQVEAEAGTEEDLRSWSPLRVAQAIAKLVTSITSATGMTIKLGDNAGANKLSILDSDDVEVQGVDSDGAFTAQVYTEEQALSDSSGDVAWNLKTSQAALLFMEGDYTLLNPTEMKAGGTHTLRVVQDGTGGHTLDFDTGYRAPGGTLPEITSAAGSMDILRFYCDGVEMHLLETALDSQAGAGAPYGGLNEADNSWDLTEDWSTYGSSIAMTLDETGIDGDPNTAVNVDDSWTGSSAASGISTALSGIDVSTTGWATMRLWIKKDATATQGAILYLPFCDDTYSDYAELDVVLSPNSGEYWTDVYDGTVNVEMRSSSYNSDWWELLVEFQITPDSAARFEPEIGPAFIDPYEESPSLPQSPSGELVIGNFEFYAETRIADIPDGSGPNFTP